MRGLDLVIDYLGSFLCQHLSIGYLVLLDLCLDAQGSKRLPAFNTLSAKPAKLTSGSKKIPDLNIGY